MTESNDNQWSFERKLSKVELYIIQAVEENWWYLPLSPGSGSMIIWWYNDTVPTSDQLLELFDVDGKVKGWLFRQYKNWPKEDSYDFKEDLNYIFSQLQIVDDLFENPALIEDKEYIEYWFDQLKNSLDANNFKKLYNKLQRNRNDLYLEYKDINGDYQELDSCITPSYDEIDWLKTRVSSSIEDKDKIEILLSGLMWLLQYNYNIQREWVDDAEDDDDWESVE